MRLELMKELVFKRKSSKELASVSLTNLIAHWKLNEESGTRNDSHSNNYHLTDVNTVGFDTGKLGNAAAFISANNEGLSIASNADIQMQTDKTFVCWVWLDNKTASQTFFSKWDSGLSTEYRFRYNVTSDRFMWTKGNGGAGGTLEDVIANTFGSPPSTTWIFCVCTYNASDKKFRISVNNGAFDIGAETTVAVVGGSTFYIGRAASAGAPLGLTGRVDSLSIWNRLLSADEMTSLYNNGSGLDYAF